MGPSPVRGGKLHEQAGQRVPVSLGGPGVCHSCMQYAVHATTVLLVCLEQGSHGGLELATHYA